jgi:hypothetical protein
MSNPEFTAPDFTAQTAATYKANIDASIAANGADAVNLGFSYSGGTFTVHDARGVALSSTNPGFVRFQDPDTAGYSKYISIEANQAFIDDAGASEIINNLFGLTSGSAYAQDVPFYLYAVSNDAMTAVALMISRVPGMTVSPATAQIGAPDDAVADEQYSFFSFDNIDETLYDTNPCTMIGSFRMQMSALDDWTVQTLDSKDGIGRFQEDREFTVPTGSFGAGSGKLLLENAGTAPVFTTNTYTYRVSADGWCTCELGLNGDGGTDGVGGVTTQLVIPFEPPRVQYVGMSMIQDPAGSKGHMVQLAATANYCDFPETDDGGVHQLTEFSAGNRFIKGQFRYQIYQG